MQSITDLTLALESGIDEIAKDFINKYGLKYEEEINNLSDPLLRWFDFTHRYIPCKKRDIIKSKSFPASLNAEQTNGLKVIEEAFSEGFDVNKFQSKGLMLNNDTSGKKPQVRTDLLWADWGIHHFHLTDAATPAGRYFSERSQWLLFAIVGDEFVGFIDIRDHGQADLFSDKTLIEAIIDSWPDLMSRHVIQGISAGAPRSSNDIGKMRRAGINTAIDYKGITYCAPGFGLTTAVTPLKVSMDIISIKRCLKQIAESVLNPENQFITDARKNGIDDPDFTIGLTNNGIAIHEKVKNFAYTLPRKSIGEQINAFSLVNEMIAPQWAVDYLYS